MSLDLTTSVAKYFEQQLAGKVVAHKVSGSGLENRGIREEVLKGIRTLIEHGVQCLLVSGAGSSLTKALGKKIEHPGTNLRITPRADIPHIEAAIRSIGDIFSGHCRELGIPYEVLPHSITHATRLLDGHKETGGIIRIERGAIDNVLSQGKLAILPFGGVDSAGATLNINADDVAARAAAVVEAVKLIMYTNEEGIMRPDKNGTWKKINFLDFHGLSHLLRAKDREGNFIINEGMWPKVKAILEALSYGVPQVHVVQAKTQALLEELFTRTGSGTLIEKEPFHRLDFPAQAHSIDSIRQLRQECSGALTPHGVPLLKPLSLEELTRLLPTTLILRHRTMPVGTVYFDRVKEHPDTALIGGIAVGENHQDSGYGRLLLESVLEQIEEAGFTRAISITASDQVKHLFDQYGKQASSDWPDVYARAKKRYGNDQNLVELYEFHPAFTPT